jgi:hypothetical protein
VFTQRLKLCAELRGRNLLAADLKVLESYASYIQGVFQSFQVPLQNDYDPDQVAAYFHRRPHILVFRFLEVHGCTILHIKIWWTISCRLFLNRISQL